MVSLAARASRARMIRARPTRARAPRAGAVALALAACAALPGVAAAATTASISPSFSPDRLGASTALTFAARFAGEGGGVPAPVSHVVVHLPAGLGINLAGVSVCAKQRLVKHGVAGCPASARIGAGTALMGAKLGAEMITENATLTAFRGPNQGGHPTLEVTGQGLTPLIERVVMTGVLQSDSPPYGQKLTMAIPAVPTLPTEPNASTLHFTLTVGGSGHGSHAAGVLRVPHSCPAAGFAFAADFAYEDGSSGSSSASVRCR